MCNFTKRHIWWRVYTTYIKGKPRCENICWSLHQICFEIHLINFQLQTWPDLACILKCVPVTYVALCDKLTYIDKNACKKMVIACLLIPILHNNYHFVIKVFNNYNFFCAKHWHFRLQCALPWNVMFHFSQRPQQGDVWPDPLLALDCSVLLSRYSCHWTITWKQLDHTSI